MHANDEEHTHNAQSYGILRLVIFTHLCTRVSPLCDAYRRRAKVPTTRQRNVPPPNRPLASTPSAYELNNNSNFYMQCAIHIQKTHTHKTLKLTPAVSVCNLHAFTLTPSVQRKRASQKRKSYAPSFPSYLLALLSLSLPPLQAQSF